VWQRQRRVAAVLDATYKAEASAGYPNADLYQLLAYCTALGLRRGHLVYAKGAGVPAVRNTEVVIVCHALDLAAPPAGLLAQVRRLAAGLASADLSTGRNHAGW
jgi:5-methylcytosine-specific restriction enzyme subunit McrC